MARSKKSKGLLAIEVGNNIYEARIAYGIPQTTLAEQVGVHSVQISRIEAGQRNTSLDLLIDIASALAVSPAQLAGWSKKNHRTATRQTEKLDELRNSVKELEVENTHLRRRLDSIRKMADVE